MNRSGVVAADGGEAAERSVPESLADLAYRRLEEAIVTLSLRPGAILNEAQMIALVDLGRTPVREALIRLAQQGKLEIASQITRVWPLAEVEDAMEALRTGQVTRAVLDHTR